MIRLAVFDLDNTLYDWVGYYAPAFRAMVSTLERDHDLDRDALLDEFRRIHAHHGTSEYALVLSELDSFSSDRDSDQRTGPHPAIRAFRREGLRNLRLYEGVTETLQDFRAKGIYTVAYTDAMIAYADYRLVQLGISDRFDEIVASKDHPVSAQGSDALSYFPLSRFASPTHERCTALSSDERKPNPSALLSLLRRWNVLPSETVYVGDSLTRDISMAQAAGVHDVLASYGKSYSSELWDQLVRITHWTPDDVLEEERLSRAKVTPTFEIQRFREIEDVVTDLNSSSR